MVQDLLEMQSKVCRGTTMLDLREVKVNHNLNRKCQQQKMLTWTEPEMENIL